MNKPKVWFQHEHEFDEKDSMKDDNEIFCVHCGCDILYAEYTKHYPYSEMTEMELKL